MSGRRTKFLRKQYQAAGKALQEEALAEVAEDLLHSRNKWRVLGILGWVLALSCGLCWRMGV